ncbi:MAG: caspase family protein, partial [Methylococcales bacterium]|nr:caspase family protein [Methylococcales bacterium]
WSIAVDKNRLVSGSADQTLKLWDLSVLQQANPPKKIYPMLNIFVSKDNEFVAWTKEGFFNASKNGAQYIGYHINQGANKAAKFVAVDKFYDTFYRPDLIARALKGEDLSKYAQGVDIDQLLKTGLAPKVAFETKSHLSKKRDVTLTFELCEQEGGYKNLTLSLNGIAIDVLDSESSAGKTKVACFKAEHPISLVNGKNVLTLKASNYQGTIESNTAKITLDYKGVSRIKPTLHILALGIDKYRDGDLQLKYSVADAAGFVEAVTSVAKPLFAEIKVYKMTDSEVTKENVLAKFKQVGANTKRNDVFMLYMAGHGITDVKTGSYYYIPYDFRFSNENSVREKAMSQQDFKLALSKIKALKSLTIIDTCNSGGYAEAQARGMLEKTAINKLARATGRSTIVASSKDQVALEGYQGHGVFTYTLIEALKGKAFNSKNIITIKGLAAYIEDVLPDRTYKKWGYEQVPQSFITGNDFPIGIKQ